MYKFASAIFENPDSLHENSKNITRHLFEQSNHPILKTEVYVTYLTVNIDNNVVDAIGVLKVSCKLISTI
jgi:hypothetical protein